MPALLVRMFAGLCLVALSIGCVHSPGGIAASNVPIEGRPYRVLGPTSATDSSIWILGLIPVTDSNTTREAMQAAIRKKQADALVDITVESYSQFWILFSRHVTSVQGKAIKFDGAPPW